MTGAWPRPLGATPVGPRRYAHRMAPDDRVRSVLLAGSAVVALAAGASWWRGAAPALGPVDPTPGPSATTPLDRALAVVDPATGQVVDRLTVRSAEPLLLHQEPGEAPVRLEARREVWRERSHLVPGGSPAVRRSGPSDETRYLLTVSCSGPGPGAVIVEFTGSGVDTPPHVVPCADGAGKDVSVLETEGGPVVARFSAADGEVDLDARLAALS